MTVFRAFASAYPSPSGDGPYDVPVFFEAENVQAAYTTLMPMLAMLWRRPVEEVDAYNLASEACLRSDYEEAGQPHPDAALLGSGYSQGQVTYLDPDRVLLYVSPREHRRLAGLLLAMQAQTAGVADRRTRDHAEA